MGTLYVFVIIVTLSTYCSAYVLSHSETDTSIASILVKEGQSAEILCMTKGTGDYFWRKGATLYNSTLVASFTMGDVTDDSQPYSVTANGTLLIRSVTLKDEGNYFCRVSSTENECYGEAKILVQASLRNFDLAIDRCDRESSCLLYLDPSQSTSVTCTALNAPPLMTLKWFNGSKEITEGIVQNELLPQNGNSREITSTVAAVYGRPASLTCQAVDPRRGNDDVRFAHAQVEMTVPAHETLPSWIIVSITLSGCFIVFGIFLLIKAKVNRKHRKKYTKLKRKDVESLTKKVNANEETINAKHQELTEFKVLAESKDNELSELKGKLRQTEEELQKSRNDNIELQTKVAKDTAKNTSAEENLESKAKSIAEFETKLKQTEEEIKKAKQDNLVLQAKIASSEAKLTAAKEIAKTKDQEIKNKNHELTHLKSKVPDQIQEMSTLKGNLESKAKSIAELETKLKRRDEENFELQQRVANNEAKITAAKEKAKTKDQEIKNIHHELTNLKGDVWSKAKAIADLESKLKAKDIELEKISKACANLKSATKNHKNQGNNWQRK